LRDKKWEKPVALGKMIFDGLSYVILTQAIFYEKGREI
jgi:hypothetical protein